MHCMGNLKKAVTGPRVEVVRVRSKFIRWFISPRGRDSGRMAQQRFDVVLRLRWLGQDPQSTPSQRGFQVVGSSSGSIACLSGDAFCPKISCRPPER